MNQDIGKLPRISFMTGCIVGVLAALAHAAASFKGWEPDSDQERQLLDLMTSVKLDAIRKMGAERTMLDISDGFGWHWTWSVGAWALVCLALRFWRPGDAGLLRASALASAAFFAVSLAIS